MSLDVEDPPLDRPDRRPRTWVRLLLLALVAVFVVFWTWALFFASKDSINRIDDTAWAARAELICEDANAQRIELSDYRQIDESDPGLIAERAAIVDDATDIIEDMIDDVAAVTPSDPKGRAIVPEWVAEYRSYLDARRTYADQLRASGENLPFYEPAVNGVPVSERLETFAGDNDMPACAPPRDLTR